MAWVDTQAGRIGIAQRGSAGIPLVFLHGVGSDKSAWTPQLARFGADRRCVALDYPGYGESAPLADERGAPHDRFAAAMLGALDALGIERAHVCGLSLGGVVAIAMAHHAPGRIASLTLADSFAVHPDGPAILERALGAGADMAGMASARVPFLLAPGASAALTAELVAVMARIDPEAFRIGVLAVWPADQRDRAAAITAQTLILCGREDPVTPPALSRALAALIPRAITQIIPAAGHLPNLEQPVAFDAALDAFLLDVEHS